MRGTWGTQIQWLHSLLKAPGPSAKGVLPGVKTPDSMEGLNAQAEAWAYLRNNSKDKSRG